MMGEPARCDSVLKCLHVSEVICERWQCLGTDQGLTTDTDIANFLFQHYEETKLGTLASRFCAGCKGPLILYCPRCGCLSKTDTSGLPEDVLRQQSVDASCCQFGHSSELAPDGSTVRHKESYCETDEPLSRSSYLAVPVSRPQKAEAKQGDALGDVHHLQSTSAVDSKACLLKQTSTHSWKPEVQVLLSSTDCFAENLASEGSAREETGAYRTTSSVCPITVVNHTKRAKSISQESGAESSVAVIPAAPMRRRGRPRKESQAVSIVELQDSQKARAAVLRPRESQSMEKSDKAIRFMLVQQHPLISESNVSGCENQSDVTDIESEEIDILQRQQDSKNSFECQKCWRTFSSGQSLNNHVKVVHENIRPHECENCGRQFSQKALLKVHKRKHTGETPFACSQCDAKYQNKLALKWHIMTHGSKQLHTCSQCGAGFKYSNSLKGHMRKHTGERPYRCQLCDKTFAESTCLKAHLRVHKGEKLHCSVCSRGFLQPSNLRRHMKTHKEQAATSPANLAEEKEPDIVLRRPKTGRPRKHFFDLPYVGDGDSGKESMESSQGEDRSSLGKALSSDRRLGKRQHQCYQCGAAFINSGGLTIHMRSHTGEKPYKCDQCGRCFASASILKKHVNVVHLKMKPFQCDICEKSLGTSAALTVHKRKHTGETPFRCNQCSSAFAALGTLQQHMKSHSDLRPFLCEECGAAFKHEYSLKIHTRKHTGEKPFKCQLCDRAFMEVVGLKAHMRAHTGEKLICTVCGTGVSGSSNLRRHMRTHTGVKPYVCSTCNKGFCSAAYLRIHQRIHTGDKRYVCELCGKAFIQKGEKVKHMARRHKSSGESSSPPLKAK